jgi:hypothetical protein
MFAPMNHLSSSLYSNCSITIRSLLTEYNICNNKALHYVSGLIDGRRKTE